MLFERKEREVGRTIRFGLALSKYETHPVVVMMGYLVVVVSPLADKELGHLISRRLMSMTVAFCLLSLVKT